MLPIRCPCVLAHNLPSVPGFHVGSSVLLINANRCSLPYPVYPLGLSHVAAALTNAGHRVRVLDVMFDDAVIEKEIEQYCPALIGISLRNIDDVNMVSREWFVPDLVDLVSRCRAVTTVPVVVGGSAFSLFPRELLEASGADFGIVGEGETALCELVAALASGSRWNAVAGLVYRAGGRVQVNPAAQFLQGPHIGEALRPPELARRYLDKSSLLNIQTQRGCPFTCCYCTYPLIEGCRVRGRDPQCIVEEMSAARAAGARYVFVVDSVFNTTREHVVAVCEALLARGLDLRWSCFLRPHGIDRELMEMMGRAGLTHIEFGSDSLCDSVLEAYGKRFTFDDVVHASECARNSRIWYSHFLISGGPGETLVTIEEGFRNSQRLERTVIFPFVGMRLYPRTPLYERAVREGVAGEQTDLLHPFFYLAPGLSFKEVDGAMRSCAARSRAWIYGEVPQSFSNASRELRRRGVEGPLWEYLIINAGAAG